jgi:hypothetical protein
MNAVSPPPAGWYPDPSGRAPFRYWDGIRWTEHTDQGTAPSPSPTSPNPPAPPGAFAGSAPTYTPAAPAGYAPGGYAPGGYAPAATVTAPAGANWNAQTFLADLKRLDGFALVVVGALLFIVFSLLSWTDGSITANGQKSASSSNGWDGDGAWLIRGWEVNETNAVTMLNGGNVDSGTDMVVLLPIALIAAGAAAASRLGKRIGNVNEIVLGASALLAVLMIAEAVHVSGAIDDLVKLLDGVTFQFQNGTTALLGASGSVAFGLYLAVVAALAMAGGALKTFLAARQAKA